MATKAEKKAPKKEGKEGKKLSPLEKARLAKASGKKGDGKKAKAKKPGLPVFKAPAEFKPFFMKVSVKIAKDGLFADMKAVRVKGSPTNESAKTVDMADWDPATLRRLMARYAGPLYVVNQAKRLPANSTINFLMRVGAKKDTGALTVSMKEFRIKVEGKEKFKELDKKDPIYRRARKPARILPGAFTAVKPFPSAAELKEIAKEKNDEPVVKKKSKKNKD